MFTCEIFLQKSDFKNPRLVHSALEYAQLGYRVFPLVAKSKVPQIERWQARATCDPEQIVSWFESWPNANIGIATGKGLVVVDVDPRNGGTEAFNTLVKRHGWPKTAHAMTGSSGDHYFFKVRGSHDIQTKTNWKQGIDIKSEGGYVVAAPSVHPVTGCDYVWLHQLKYGVAELPDWILGALGKQRQPTIASAEWRPAELSRPGETQTLLLDAIARFPVTQRGQRNDVMARLIASLIGRGFNEELIEQVVHDWWIHYYDQQKIGTSPNEASKDIRACIASTLRSETFRRAVGADHRANLLGIELSAEQRELMEKIRIHPNTRRKTTPPNSNRVTSERKLCDTENERLFVEALLIYFTYKIMHVGESPPKATNAQIRWSIEDRHSKVWPNPIFEREFRKFITRRDRPATKYELAIQTLKGKPSTPSEYKLTGLLELMPLRPGPVKR